MAKSISSSTKISIEGDYDSFARRPRKKYIKLNATAEMNTNAPQSASQINGDGQVTVTDGQAGKRMSTSDSVELELPIKAFPNDSAENAKRTSVIHDSLPTRRQAKVELMKLARREISEEKLASQSSTRNAITESKNRTYHEHSGNHSPPAPPRREAVTTEKDLSEKTPSSHRAMSKGLWSNRQEIFSQLREPPTNNSKSLVKAIVVRSLLPPIKSSKTKQVHVANNGADEQIPSDLRVTNKAAKAPVDNIKSLDMKYHFQRGSRLRQGSTKYVYRPNSNQFHRSIHRKLPRHIRAGTGDSYINVIQWRTRAHYNGKLPFHKRPTSPTLGEEAIEKKVTNRLPTRQIHQVPGHANLYSETLDYRESWRRPPSNTSPKGVVLTPPQRRKPAVPPPYETTFWRRTILARMPPHRMPVHKAKVHQE